MPGPRSLTESSPWPPAASTRTTTVLVGHLERERDVLALGAEPVDLDRAAGDVHEVSVGEVVRDVAPLDPGEVEHVLDERGEPLALADDDRQVMSLCLLDEQMINSIILLYSLILLILSMIHHDQTLILNL